MPNIAVPILKNVSGDVSPDGKHIMLELSFAKGDPIRFALPSDDFTKFISFVINLVLERVPKQVQDKTEAKTITAQPIMVSEMGVARGRSPDEALVSFRASIFQMAFAVNLATLLESLERLRSMISVDPNPPRPN